MTFKDHRSPIAQQRWMECENKSGVVIPAFSVMEVSTTSNPSPGRLVLSVIQPDTNVDQLFVFNSHLDIPVSGFGMCTIDGPFYGAIDWVLDPGGDGDIYGPKSGSWIMRKHRPGYTSKGGLNLKSSTNPVDRMLFMRGSESLQFAVTGGGTGITDGSTIPISLADGANTGGFSISSNTIIVDNAGIYQYGYNMLVGAASDNIEVQLYNDGSASSWSVGAEGSDPDSAIATTGYTRVLDDGDALEVRNISGKTIDALTFRFWVEYRRTDAART